jgi:hypothetical protein
MKKLPKIFDYGLFRFRYPVSLIEPAYYWLDVRPKILKWVLSFAPISFILFGFRSLRKVFFKISVNERIVEDAFVLSRLKGENLNILDFGSTSSWLSLRLASLGHKITSLDLRSYEFSHSNIKLIQGDIFETELPKNSFDAVVTVSTLEHVGLDIKKYGEGADKKAVAILSETLKNGGNLFITVPYGQFVVTPSHRVYSEEGLIDIIPDNMTMKEKKYYVKQSDTAWVLSNEREASLADSSKESNAVVCILLEKR